MSGSVVLGFSAVFALVIILIAMTLTVIRLILGPTLADRILALDTLSLNAVGFVAALVALTGFGLYVDIAIALALVGLLSTLALVRYLLVRSGGADD